LFFYSRATYTQFFYFARKKFALWRLKYKNKEAAICVPDGTTPEMRSLDFGTHSALEG